jgi:hypothetical protein
LPGKHEDIKQKDRERKGGDIEQDTSFESICTVCMEFKSSDKTNMSNINTLPLSAVKKYCYRTTKTMELDGTFSICNTCKQSIKRKQVPPKSQRDLFQLSNFPVSLLKLVEKTIRNQKVQLNKVEQFVLKLVIPFIRVAHCERGTQMKVRGNLILISADVASSLSKILPLSQNIVPIRFKRKLTYDGHYLAEYVDRRKVELYFNWFQKNNPLYKDMSLDDELLEKFEDDLREDADVILQLSQQDKSKIGTQEDASEDEHQEADELDELDDEIDIFQPDEGNLHSESDDEVDEKSEEQADIAIWQQHSTVMSNKYALQTDTPTEANKMADLIICLEQEGVLGKELIDEIDLDHMTDDIRDFFKQSCRIEDEVVSEDDDALEEDQDQMHDDVLEENQGDQDQDQLDDETTTQEASILESAKRHRRRALDNMSTISVAPGEKGEFQNWKGDVFLEEKAFPHLFPFGTGGYLSSCLSSKKNMGFSVYCRNRLRSVDSKFREDQVYIFFLLLVKELVELKNCQSTYLRQARNTPGLTKEHISDTRYHNLQRYNRSYFMWGNLHLYKHEVLRDTARAPKPTTQ